MSMHINITKIMFILPVFLTFQLLTGCGPRTLSPGAGEVHVYDSFSHKSCKFLGNITDLNVHGDLNLSSTIAEIQKDDINFLKNEGAKLGANVVVLMSHKSYEAKIKRAGKRPQTSLLINKHDVVAKAYFCSSGLNQNAGQKNATHVNISETPLI